jgi:hypothetical protein
MKDEKEYGAQAGEKPVAVPFLPPLMQFEQVQTENLNSV